MAMSDMDVITEQVIGCAYRVGSTLGCGFLEKVYENALLHELRKTGLAVEPQYAIRVIYDGVVVGEFVADLYVEGQLLVEVKAVRQLNEVHMAQCLNYLKATRRKLCLLMNFGGLRVTVRRIIY
jgi:GxxExxY protein